MKMAWRYVYIYNPTSHEYVLELAKTKSRAVREIWSTTTSKTIMELWFLRNKMIFRMLQKKKPC